MFSLNNIKLKMQSSVQQGKASPDNILPVVPVLAPKLCSGMTAFSKTKPYRLAHAQAAALQ